MVNYCGKNESLPYLKEIVPERASDGSTVELYGRHFHNIISVEFDKFSIYNFKKHHNKITFTLPYLKASKIICVKLKTLYGCSNALPLKYDSPVFIRANVITPKQGSMAGGEIVYIFGSGFSQVNEINFGINKVDSFDIINDNEIQLTTPPSPSPGAVKVRLNNNELMSNFLLYTYLPLPPIIIDDNPETLSLTSLNRAFGSLNGGESITINGTGLWRVKNVTFNDSPVSLQYILDEHHIIIVAPPVSTARNVNVVAHTFNEDSNVLIYTYLDLPQI